MSLASSLLLTVVVFEASAVILVPELRDLFFSRRR